MRIAQVAPLFESVPPRLYGGTERVVSWLTEKLVDLGHEVTLFASGDSITNARLIPACKQALRLDADCIDHTAHHILMLEKVFSRASEFDMIHFHSDYWHFPLSRRQHVPCITTLHGRLDIPDLVPLYEEFREMPVISISNSQRAPLPWLNWRGTVHHGLPPKSLALGSGKGGYLAFLGRISPEKGVDQAIQIAIQAGIPVKLAAKVDRADHEYFQQTIKPMLKHPLVEFIGEIGADQKSEFLGNAMALLVPIVWPEPFGLVMIEAMACGTPIIAYPRGSVPEIVVNKLNGFIVKDVDSAVQAVTRLDEIDRNACRKYFDQYFTDDRMAREYVSVYSHLIQKRPAALTLAKEVFPWTTLTSASSTT
jgi:glycosyltransferase involved in cell wall biosynthesis